MLYRYFHFRDECEEKEYFLRGIICHNGEGVECGHYTTYLNEDDGTWIHFDDENVCLKTFENVCVEAAKTSYLIFYEILNQDMRRLENLILSKKNMQRVQFGSFTGSK